MQTENLFGPICNELPSDLLEYYSGFFTKQESLHYFDRLTHGIRWKQEEIKIYGKLVKTPRLTAWYGDPGIAYKYSGIRFEAMPWTLELLQIKEKIEVGFDVEFNSVLLNLYRDGRDSMGWHSDDEPELGLNPVIASVNFGQERRFDFRHKNNHALKHQVLLSDGSVLLMKGDIQHHWQHQVAKTFKPIGARINLTFREIVR